jgi:hypothetical protein
MGWLVGGAVLLITLGVIVGLIGIAVVAKRKQRFRINEPSEQPKPGRTNTPSLTRTNGIVWIDSGLSHQECKVSGHGLRSKQSGMAGLNAAGG